MQTEAAWLHRGIMASIWESRAGRYTAQVNTGGKRTSKTFPTKVEAKRWARQLEVAIDDGKRPAVPSTFTALAEEYLAAMVDTAAPSPSKLAAIRIITEHIGRMQVSDLNVAAYRDFAKQRRNSGAGPATILMDLSYIRTILRHGGALSGLDTASAVSQLESARVVLSASGVVSRPNERKRRPTAEELNTLCNFWMKRRRGIDMWAVTQFAISTAMRLSEITRISWSDLDQNSRTVIIRDRKHPRNKKGNDQKIPLLRGPTIIGGSIIDPLEIIIRQPRIAAEIFPYKAATVSTAFTRGSSACEIDNLRFHDLRHDGVSRLFEAGYAIEQVALVSGHQDWNMLRRYTQIAPESLHRD